MSNPQRLTRGFESSSLVRLVCALAWAVVSLGCWNVGPRRPLFGGTELEPSAGPARASGPIVVGGAEVDPEGKLRESPTDALLERLRDTTPGPEREAAWAELRRRQGEPDQARVRAALEEERLLVEFLVGLLDPRLAYEPPLHLADAPEPAWIAEKYALARDRYTAGDLLGALRVLDALLALEPGSERIQEVRRLKARCEERLVETSWLTARIEPKRAVIPSTAALQIEVVLENVSDQRIVLAHEEEAAVGVVFLDYEELNRDGTRTRIRTQQGVTLSTEELTLAPKSTRRLPVAIPSAHARLAPGAVGRYTLSGRLRPTRIEVGGAPASRFLTLRSRRLIVLGERDLPLAEGPAERFAEQVRAASSGTYAAREEPARAAFVAAVVLGQGDRELALKTLAEALPASQPPLAHALCAAMGRVNGEPLNFTKDEWLAWWAQRRPPAAGEPAEGQEEGDLPPPPPAEGGG